MKASWMTSGLVVGILALMRFCAIGVNGQCTNSNKPNHLNFTIKLDSWAHEVSWTVSDRSSGNVKLFGNGTWEDDYSVISQDVCVSDGCYELEIKDSWGDGIYSWGYYGWFTLELNDDYLTIGEQTFDGDDFRLYFCTSLIAKSSNSDRIELTLDTYDYNTDFYIVSADHHNFTTLYYNEYEYPDYYDYNDTVSNTLYIDPDAAGCVRILMDNSFIDSSNAKYTIGYSFDGGATTEESYTRENGDVFDLSFDICTDNATSAPTPRPTFGPPDNIFNVAEYSNFKSTDIIGCPYDWNTACTGHKTWQVNGVCENPRLTMSVMQTDFDWYSEQAYIYINGEYIGNCAPLSGACSDNFKTCNLTDELSLDLEGYFDPNNETNTIQIGLGCSSEVNICGVSINDSDSSEYGNLEAGYYVCLGEAEIKCDVYDGYTTNMPTSAPTPAREVDDMYNLTINIKLDSHPDEITWWLYDEFLLQNVWLEDGANYNAYDEISFTFEIGYGCYWLYFNDSEDWQNADPDGTYGWYDLQLNKQDITHGSQAIGNFTYGWYGIFAFCTNFFDVPQGQVSIATFEPENKLYLDTYNYFGEIIFIENYYWGDLEWGTIFYNPDEDGNVVSSEIPISKGCYLALFYSYDYWASDYWYELRINNVTVISQAESYGDYYTYIDFCTNTTGEDTEYEFEYDHKNCSSVMVESSSESDEYDVEDLITFTFNVKFDNWPEETNWTLINEDTLEIVLYGDGDDSEDYEEVYHATCIEAGCYHLYVEDEWGDGMYHWYDDYGWFRVYVDGKEISLGKQAIEGHGGYQMYFCTELFENGQNNVTIETEYNDTQFKILGDDYETQLYKNNFLLPGFLSDVAGYDEGVATIHVAWGCYYIKSSNEFSVEVNGDQAEFELLETSSSGYTYEAHVCGTKLNVDGSGGGSAATDSSNDTILVIIVIVSIIVIVGAIAVISMRLKDNKQSNQINSANNRGGNFNNDQLAQEPKQSSNNGGWDMGTLGGGGTAGGTADDDDNGENKWGPNANADDDDDKPNEDTPANDKKPDQDGVVQPETGGDDDNYQTPQ